MPERRVAGQSFVSWLIDAWVPRYPAADYLARRGSWWAGGLERTSRARHWTDAEWHSHQRHKQQRRDFVLAGLIAGWAFMMGLVLGAMLGG